VLVGVKVGVCVAVATGVGWRQAPDTQNCPAVQQVVPHGVVPATQVQRLRPVLSAAPHVPEQQSPFFMQIPPPSRHDAAMLRSPITTAPPSNAVPAAVSNARRLVRSAIRRVRASNFLLSTASSSQPCARRNSNDAAPPNDRRR
jgi:hypothetical protein